METEKPQITEAVQQQPIIVGEGDTARSIRFKPNTIIDWLLDETLDLNSIVAYICQNKDKFPQEDIDQLYQLMGYSIPGYCELNLVSDEAKDNAYAVFEEIIAKQGKNGNQI